MNLVLVSETNRKWPKMAKNEIFWKIDFRRRSEAKG